MAAPDSREQSRPGLRERRLSRVHFEDAAGATESINAPHQGHARGQGDPSVQPPSLGRGNRSSVQSNSNNNVGTGASGGRQDYFESGARQGASTNLSAAHGEECRGRPVGSYEGGDEDDDASNKYIRLRGPPGRTPFEMPMPTEDLSPKSTSFGSDAPAVTVQQSAPHFNQASTIQPFPRSLPQDPRVGPFAAHLRGSDASQDHPTLPELIAPRRLLGNFGTEQHLRRASAPTDRRQELRLGTAATPRNSVEMHPNDPYTMIPPPRSTAPRASQYNPYHGRGSMDLYERAQASPTPAYSYYEPPTALPAPPYHTQPALSLKPALRRTQTEEETRRTTRDAVDIVHHHTQGLRRRNVPGNQTLESMPRNAGVLSNLLQLYGDSAPAGPRRSMSNDSKWDGESAQMSRATSVDSHFAAPRGKFGRTESAASFATTLCEGDLDPDDPRARRLAEAEKYKERPGLPMSRDDRFSYSDAVSTKSKKSFKNMLRRTKSFLVDEDAVYSDLMGKKSSEPPVGKDKRRRLSITKHVADILARHNFLLKLAKALMTYGSPSHRMEQQLNATAQVLEVDAQFVHLPSVVIASFGDSDTHTSETHFVKASGGLDLGKLHHVHNIYRQVVHDEAGVAEGSAALSRLMKAKPIYKVWQRMIFAAICAGTIAPIGFGGSFVDAWVAAAFGAALSFLQNHVVGKSPAYSNIFEISVATVTSFIARGLSTTDYFCYPALATSGVVLILPGYAILCGSLELASKNIVTGSVRMVYAIIYSLFLGFGIAVGSDLYFLVDPAGRDMQMSRRAKAGTITIQGAFHAMNGSTNMFMDGQWTFTNDTTANIHSSANDALFQGNIACARDPSWQWWRQGVPPYTLFALVPLFTLFLCLNNLQPIYSRQLPVMVIIACIGFVTNTVANRYIFDHSDIVSFIGSFVVGMLGNLYSRIFRGTGFVVMVPGVLFLVPSGIAAAGGLAMTQVKDHGDSYSNGLLIGFRMVQVAIGITVGLFFSSFIVYSFGRRKQAALFAF